MLVWVHTSYTLHTFQIRYIGSTVHHSFSTCSKLSIILFGDWLLFCLLLFHVSLRSSHNLVPLLFLFITKQVHPSRERERHPSLCLNRGDIHVHLSITIGWWHFSFLHMNLSFVFHPIYLKSPFCTWKFSFMKASRCNWIFFV